MPSYGVPVTDKGKLTFIVMRRLHGKLARRALGQYPIMTLAKAREAALGALRHIERGILIRRKKRGRGACGSAPAGKFLRFCRRGIHRPTCAQASLRPRGRGSNPAGIDRPLGVKQCFIK